MALLAILQIIEVFFIIGLSVYTYGTYRELQARLRSYIRRNEWRNDNINDRLKTIEASKRHAREESRND